MAASPHMLTAWADTSRENGEGGRKRGSVAILEDEGTGGSDFRPGTVRHSPYDGAISDDARARRPSPRARTPDRGPTDGWSDERSALEGRRRRGRRHPVRPGPVPEPRAVVARLQRPGARAGRGRRPAARSSGPSSSPSSPRTSTSSSRSGSRASRSRWTPGCGPAPPTASTPREQLRAVRGYARELVERHTAVFNKDVAPALEEVGIQFTSWTELSDADRAELGAVFEDQIFPVLTPLAVDPSHPFPYISNLSLNLAVLVRDPHTRRTASPG